MGLVSLIFLSVVLVLVLIVVFGRLLFSSLSPKPQNLGIQENGLLKNCPNTPNCVCSQCPQDSPSFIEPISFSGSKEQAMNEVLKLAKLMSRNLIVEQDRNYLWLVFRSSFWGFLDDVELLINEEEGLIHFRSAARLGYFDFGVNRKRMERFKIVIENSRS